MKFVPTPTHRKRLSLLLRRCSAGIGMTGLLISTPAMAQDSQGSRFERQLNSGQSGFNNPVQRGVGEAARGIIQGQNFGDAARAGVQAGVDQQFGYDRQVQQQGQPIYRDQYGRQYIPQPGGQQFGGQFGGQTAGSSGQENVVTRFNVEGQPYRVRIENPDGARLGISMTSEQEQVKIQNVARGSAAAAAGLRSGDTIVTANGRQIEAPQDLIEIVDQRSPGDELNLTVKRDGEQQTLTAKLQSYASDQRSMARPRMDGGSGMSNEAKASGQANQDGQTEQTTDAPAASSEETGEDTESGTNENEDS